MTKLPAFGFLFSTPIRVGVVAKSVILGILFITSFILILRAVEVTKLVILGTSFSTSSILTQRVVLVATSVISSISSLTYLILALHASFHIALLHHLVYLIQ